MLRKHPLSVILMLLAFTIYFLSGTLSLFCPRTAIQGLEEGCFLGLFFLTISRGRLRVWSKGNWLFIGYIFWTFISGLVNNYSFADTYLHCRYWLDLCILLIYITNTDFSNRDLAFIFKWLTFLVFLQVPASIVNIMLRGRVESYVGTLSSHGGGLGTTFTTIALGYPLAYYFYYRKKWTSLLLTMSLLIIGYSNLKRGVYFYFAAFLLVGFFLESFLSRNTQKVIGNLVKLAILGPIVFVAFLYLIGTTPQFEPVDAEKTIAGKANATYEVVSEYSGRVGIQERDGGYSSRTGCSDAMLRMIIHGYPDFWNGVGPTSMTERKGSVAAEKYLFVYGASGWIYDCISIGFPGFLLNLGVYLWGLTVLLTRFSFLSLPPLGKIMYFGSFEAILVMLAMYFSYSSGMCTSMVLPSIALVPLFFLLGIPQPQLEELSEILLPARNSFQEQLPCARVN